MAKHKRAWVEPNPDHPRSKKNGKFVKRGTAIASKAVAAAKGNGNASFLAKFSAKIEAKKKSGDGLAGLSGEKKPNALAGLSGEKKAAVAPPAAPGSNAAFLAKLAAKQNASVKVAGPATLPKRAAPKVTEDAAPAKTYRQIVGDDAVKMHAQVMRQQPWTPAQRRAVQRYTDEEYKEINGFLRNGGQGEAWARADAENVRAAMREIPEDIQVFRVVSATGFGYPNKQPIPDSALDGLVGRVWSDPGFTSTSINPEPYDYNAKVRMRISVPKGTRGIYVDTVSQNKGEEEMLLDAGTKFRIDRAVKDERGITTMYMTVVG